MINQQRIEQLPVFEKVADYLHFYTKTSAETDALVIGDTRINYRQLSELVSKYAKALIAAGISKGDRVATLCTPQPDYFITFLACSSIGAVWMGLNPKYQIDEYRYVLKDATPKLIFSYSQIGERSYLDILDTLKKENESLEQVVIIGDLSTESPFISDKQFLTAGSDVSNETLLRRYKSIDATDPALLVYTSGSTGNPKGALIHQYGLTKVARVQNGYWDVDPVRIINFLPVNHLGCLGDISLYCFIAGGTQVFMEDFDPDGFNQLMQDEKITIWGGVPTSVQMSVEHPDFHHYDLSALQMIIWSGAAASEPLIQKLLSICPRLSNSYGQTESVGSICFAGPTDDIDELANSVGAPVPCYEVRIVDERGSKVEVGESGEIQVRGDFIMQGYLNQPEKTAETIDSNGWLKTGDLGLVREDGNVTLVGRLKEMFKSGGYNVYPREIEQVLENFSGVELVAVVSSKDDLFGEVGIAYIQVKEGIKIEPEQLKSWCKSKMVNYKVPKKFVLMDSLPLLPIGKIDKKALSRMALELS